MNKILLLIFLPGILFSQVVNVEGMRQSDEKGWSGTTKFSFSFKESAQINWEFNNTTYLQWDNDNWSLLFLNEINFDRAGGVDFENDGFQHLRLSKHINSNYTSETYVQNQFDPVRKIKNRKLFGSGVRVRMSGNNYLGVSAFYEKELLMNEIVNDGFRLSSYLQLDFNLSDKMQFLTTTYLQPDIEQFSDFKLSTESQLNFKISKNFSFTNTVVAIYDSYPAAGVKELTYSFKNGVKYKF